MKNKFYFLCGHFEKINFIYAVKFEKHSWHYFEELDSIESEHNLLPAVLHHLIGTLNKVKTIEVPISDELSKHYFDGGKFIFKNKELKTHLELANKQCDDKSSKNKSLPKSTFRLVFNSGHMNPLLFLNEYEKCSDVKTDKDKMYKIRNFVDESHIVEFNEMYFTSDWPTVRQKFLKKYSQSFTTNKKRELNVDFNNETSLRSFFERKLLALSSYTTLSFINQIEITLNELPDEISNLFIVNEKMYGNKVEIFEFCDSIQDLVETMREATVEEPAIQNNLNSLNNMEIFNFDQNLESELESMQSTSDRGRSYTNEDLESEFESIQSTSSRGRGRGRPSKKQDFVSGSIPSTSGRVRLSRNLSFSSSISESTNVGSTNSPHSDQGESEYSYSEYKTRAGRSARVARVAKRGKVANRGKVSKIVFSPGSFKTIRE